MLTQSAPSGRIVNRCRDQSPLAVRTGGGIAAVSLVLVRAQYVAAAPVRDTCCNTGFGSEPELLAFGIIGSSKGFFSRIRPL